MSEFNTWYIQKIHAIPDPYDGVDATIEMAWNHQQSKIDLLQKKVDILTKSNDFYANENNWWAYKKTIASGFREIVKSDMGKIEEGDCGGKLARQCKKEIEGLE
jgi:hypothetical protein